MKSGMRGGKPRDMATHKNGGKVKKHSAGGAIRDALGEYVRDPLTGTRQYATFSDWMGDLFGKKKAEEPKAKPAAAKEMRAAEDTGTPNSRESISGVPTMQGVDTAPAPVRRPSQAQSRNVQRQRALRMAAGPGFLPSDEAVTGPTRSRTPRPMSEAERAAEQPDLRPRPRSDVTPETETPGFRPPGPVMREGRRPLREMEDELETMARERATQAPYTRIPRARESEVMRNLRRAVHGEERARQMESEGYKAKGGSVQKYAKGGSCRGMGAAQRGGKYTIK